MYEKENYNPKPQHVTWLSTIWKLKLAALTMFEFKNSGSSLRAWIELVLSSILKVFERDFWIDYKSEWKDLKITQDSPF